MKDLNAIIAKHETPATAEPALDPSSAPPAEGSGAGSAVADVVPPGDPGANASPTAPIDPPLNHDELRAKLDREKAARALKDERRRARLEREAAEKERKEAAAEREKWKALGKDETWLAKIKAAGADPREVYEEMRQEALRTGTPDARIDALAKELAEEKAARAKEKEETAKQREERERAEARQAEERAFAGDFRNAVGVAKYAPLLEEYEPEQLFAIATNLRHNPRQLLTAAASLNVSLQNRDGTFTMQDIFDVMHATQAAHRARMQRRIQSAAPQSSEADQTQSAEVTTPTVNGTVERKAGTNAKPSGREAELELLKKMSKHERREYLAKKHP